MPRFGTCAVPQDFLTVSACGAALSITKTHSGNLHTGADRGSYTRAPVTNSAAADPTSGTVTVTETVPSGMTLVSMAGDEWTCSFRRQYLHPERYAGGGSILPGDHRERERERHGVFSADQ